MKRKITKRYCAFILFLLCYFLKVEAQNAIVYDYDNAGNRISRVLSSQKSATITFPANEKKIKVQDKLTEEESLIKVYPNPTTGIIKISLENYPDPIIGECRIYNLNGTVLKHTKLNSSFTEVSLSDCINGTYIMRLIINDKLFDYKIIKQ